MKIYLVTNCNGGDFYLIKGFTTEEYAKAFCKEYIAKTKEEIEESNLSRRDDFSIEIEDEDEYSLTYFDCSISEFSSCIGIEEVFIEK